MYGSDAATIRLLVLERPEPPVDVRVTEGGSRSIQLQWAVQFDGNTPITGFLIQLNNASGNTCGCSRKKT